MPPSRELALRFLGALQFLTLLRFRFITATYEEAAVFFPFVGGVLGFLTGLFLLWTLTLPLPGGLAAALALGLLSVATGLRQEKGLARLADTIGGRSPVAQTGDFGFNRPVGVHGVAAIAFTTFVRWQALAVLTETSAWFLLAAVTAAGVLSRGTIIFLAATSRPIGSGMATALIGSVSGWLLLLTGLQVSVASSLLGWKGTAPLLFGGIALVALLRRWLTAILGGVTGNSLSSCSLLMECIVLTVAAWKQSF